MPIIVTTPATALPERNWLQSVTRGVRGRCPHCGKGRLFSAFLKPVAACETCGEDLSHQRADDLPPYIVITIVGHVILGGFLAAERFDWSTTTSMILWPSLTVIMALALMQPAKGGVIGLQWAMRMHGFGGPDSDDNSLPRHADGKDRRG